MSAAVSGASLAKRSASTICVGCMDCVSVPSVEPERRERLALPHGEDPALGQLEARHERDDAVHAIPERRDEPAEFDARDPPERVQDEVDLLFDRHQARRDAVLRRRTTTALSESKGGGPEVLPRELQLDLLLWLRARRHVPTRVVAKPLELGHLEPLRGLPEMLVLQEATNQLRPRVLELLSLLRPPRHQHLRLDPHEQRGHLEELARPVQPQGFDTLDRPEE